MSQLTEQRSAPVRQRLHWRTFAIIAAGGILLTLLCLTVALQRPYAMRLDPTGPTFEHAATDWNAPERAANGAAFRWSTDTSTMTFRAARRILPANRPLLLTMTIAARPSGAPVSTVTLLANGQTMDSWPSNVSHPVSVDVGVALRTSDDLSIVIHTDPYTPAGDKRELGVELVSDVRLAASPGFALPAPNAIANAILLVLLAALAPTRRLRERWRLVTSAGMLVIVTLGTLLAREPFWRIALPLAIVLGLVAAAVWAPIWWASLSWPIRAIQQRFRLTDRWVLAAGVVLAVAGQTLITLHRRMSVGTLLLVPGIFLLLVPLLPLARQALRPAASTDDGDGHPAQRMEDRKPAAETMHAVRALPWLVIALVGIAVLAVALRAALITEMPASLFRDEGRHALRAIRILDDSTYRPVYETDIALPALFLYPLALAFKLFGVSLLTLRLFMATAGVLSVVFLFLLGRRLFGVRVGLIAAYLFAVSFWALRMQRVGLIPSFSTMVVLLALVLFARAVSTRRYRDWAVAGLGAAGCVNVYHSSPFILVLLAGVAIGWFIRGPRQFVRLWLLRFALFAAIFLIGAAPMITYILHNRSDYFARPDQTAVFSEMNLRLLGQDQLAALTTNILPNLGMYTVRGDHEPKHDLPFAPHFDVLTAICFLVGIGLALAGRPRTDGLLGARFVVGWLAAMLIPSILAIDAPNTLRAFDTLPPAILLAALGIDAIWSAFARPQVDIMAPKRSTALFRMPHPVQRSLFTVALVAILALNAGTYFGLMRTDPRETLRFDEYFPSQAGKRMVTEGHTTPGIAFFVPRGAMERDVFPFFARIGNGSFTIQPLEGVNGGSLPAQFAILLPNGPDDIPPDQVIAALPWAQHLQRIDGNIPAGARVPAFVEYRRV